MLPDTDPALLARCLYSLRDERCPIYFIEGVQGRIGAGRAESFRIGSNPFVAFVDPDDEIIPGICNKIKKVLSPDIGFLYTDEIIVDSTNTTIHHGWSYDRTTLQVVPEWMRQAHYDKQNDSYFQHLWVFNRDIASKFLTGLEDQHKCAEAWIAQRCMAKGRAVHLKEFGYIWKIHGKNTCMDWING
jgi:hypothetical protein